MSSINQVAFDVVYRHLLAQGEPSHSKYGLNRYHGDDGLRCVVGALIADEYYHPVLEYFSVLLSGDVYNAVVQSGYYGVSIRLLGDLQDVHDVCTPDEWPDALCKVAKTWGLEIPATE